MVFASFQVLIVGLCSEAFNFRFFICLSCKAAIRRSLLHKKLPFGNFFHTVATFLDSL